MGDESKLAVLKRVCLIVVTAHWLCWRPATEALVDVQRVDVLTHTRHDSVLVDPTAFPVVEGWRNGEVVTPDNYEEQLAVEAEWMNAVMSKGALAVPLLTPEPVPVEPAALFGQPVPASRDMGSQSGAVRVAPDAAVTYIIPPPQPAASGALRRSRSRMPQSQSASSRSRPPVDLRIDLDAELPDPPDVGVGTQLQAAPFPSTPEPTQLAAQKHPRSLSPPARDPAYHNPPYSPDERGKRVKTSTSQEEAEQAARRAELQARIDEAHAELRGLGRIKSELPGNNSPFRRMVTKLSEETAEHPLEIDDSQ